MLSCRYALLTWQWVAWPKKHSSAECKNGRFSVIPARTGSVVILGHFFDGPDGSTKFCWRRSKIKGIYNCEIGTAKKRDEPRKMTHSMETYIFLGAVRMGNLKPRVYWLYALLTKIDISKQKKSLLAPNTQIFGSKLHIFVSSGQLGTHRSMFSTRKRCLIGSLIWGYQKFYSLPPKNGILAQN